MRKNIPYEESLEYCYPNIVKKWHPKNGTLLPRNISYKSTTKVWWYLPYDDPVTKQHFDFEWQSSLRTRTILGADWPFLTGHAVWRGYNDLETWYLEIAAEWHLNKNRNKKPYMYAKFSNKKIWWKCKNNHEWRASIYSRTNLGSNYTICAIK